MSEQKEDTIRVYFELSNMAEVRAVLAFAETMGLTMHMAPIVRGRQRGTTRGPVGPSAADSQPIEKTDRFKLGPPVALPDDSEAKKRFPMVARFLGSKTMEYRHLCQTLQRNAHVDKRRAGFTISFLIRAGALVRADDESATDGNG